MTKKEALTLRKGDIVNIKSLGESCRVWSVNLDDEDPGTVWIETWEEGSWTHKELEIVEQYNDEQRHRSTSRYISIKFKELINSFDLDPREVALYIANYLWDNGVKPQGSKRGTANIKLFDEEENN